MSPGAYHGIVPVPSPSASLWAALVEAMRYHAAGIQTGLTLAQGLWVTTPRIPEEAAVPVTEQEVIDRVGQVVTITILKRGALSRKETGLLTYDAELKRLRLQKPRPEAFRLINLDRVLYISG
jgi:hypothetical protein